MSPYACFFFLFQLYDIQRVVINGKSQSANIVAMPTTINFCMLYFAFKKETIACYDCFSLIKQRKCALVSGVDFLFGF